MWFGVVGWLLDVIRLFFPLRCVICGEVLTDGEEKICYRCNLRLPRTGFHYIINNKVERMFWGKFPLERATAYLHFVKGGTSQKIIHALKYYGRQDLGEMMGRWMAADLQDCGFFADIDVIIPVPLHPRRERARGYNQSACIARGLSEVTGIPVDVRSVERSKYTETQTHKSVSERWMNTFGVFRLQDSRHFSGKHILIVDDVLTTGATTTACADTFRQIPGIRISVLTLAIAD